jgi:hypothetical protein
MRAEGLPLKRHRIGQPRTHPHGTYRDDAIEFPARR